MRQTWAKPWGAGERGWAGNAGSAADVQGFAPQHKMPVLPVNLHLLQVLHHEISIGELLGSVGGRDGHYRGSGRPSGMNAGRGIFDHQRL